MLKHNIVNDFKQKLFLWKNKMKEMKSQLNLKQYELKRKDQQIY